MEKNIYTFLSILFIFFLLDFCKPNNCPKKSPIFYNNECVIRECSREDLENNVCEISNEIVKIQWINEILTNKNVEIDNIGMAFYYKEILISSYYTKNGSNEFIYYSPSYDNKELILKSIYRTNTDRNFNEIINELLPININGQLDNYLLSCLSYYCDVINFNKKEITNFIFFNKTNLSVNSLKNILFKLNDNINYFYGTLSQMNLDYILSITTFNFSFNEESNSIEANYTEKYINEDINENQIILSCFQTEKNFIECMIVSPSQQLYVYILNEDIDLKSKIFLDASVSEYYLNSIHLQKEIGIYNYFYQDEELLPRLHIKELIYNETSQDYQLIDLINNDIFLNISYDEIFIPINDIQLLKMTNKKFVIIYIVKSLNTSNNYLLIIFCTLYGRNDELKNLIVRYYYIPFKLYGISHSLIEGVTFNNYIGVSMVDSQKHPFLIIFGNIISIEPDKIININKANSTNSFFIVNLKYYINNNIKINNNLFGYEFIRIKIDKLLGTSNGIIYYLLSNNNIISENDILNIDDSIKIDYSNSNIKINEDYYFEIIPLYGYSDYDKYNSFPDFMERFGDEDQKDYFESQTFEGSSLRITYNFSCHINCETCEYIGISLDNQKCLSCANGFCYMGLEKNCFNIDSLIYNYYNEVGTLICVPLNEICPDDFPFEDKNTKECKEMITFEDLVLENHIYSNSKKVIDKLIDLFYKEIKNKNIVPENDTIIKGYNVIFQTSTLERQKYYIDNGINNNISSINLNECEDILKSSYGINDSLIILKVDIKRNDTPSTQVEYQIINPKNFEILNLTKCNDAKIDIYSPVDLSQEYIKKIKHLKDQGYDIFDSQDSFYNDICSSFNSENSTDVIIKDRKLDFYNPNISLCENSCEYKSFDVNTSRVNCECEIKKEINSDISGIKFSTNSLLENFYSFDKYTNYKVLKCYNLVLDLNKLKKNIGSYILASITFLFIFFMIINFITEKKKYKEILDEIISIKINFDKIYNDKKGKKIKNSKKSPKKKIKNQKNSENISNKNDDSGNEYYTKKKKKVNFTAVNNHKDSFEDNKQKNHKIYFTRNDSRNNKKNKDILNENVYKRYKSDFRNSSNPPKKRNIKNKKMDNYEITQGENKLTHPKSRNKNKENKKKKSIANDNIYRKSIIKKKKRKYKNTNTNEGNKSSQRVMNNGSSKNYESNLINRNKNVKKTEKNKKHKIKSLINEKNPEKKNERINTISKKVPKLERYQYFIDTELNALEYKYAINIDFRSFFQYYWALLKQTHIIIFTFITRNDYNLFLLKVDLLLMSLSLNFVLNTLFFTDDSMHKIYQDYGTFDFIYNIPQTIYSILISSFITFLFELLALSDDNLLKFKEKENLENINLEKKKEIKYLIIKSILFFIIGLISLLFFWYYVTCFCAVYHNTQIHLIKDTFISYGIGMIYPFILTFIPALIRIPALRNKNTCLYRFSRILSTAISLI